MSSSSVQRGYTRLQFKWSRSGSRLASTSSRNSSSNFSITQQPTELTAEDQRDASGLQKLKSMLTKSTSVMRRTKIKQTKPEEIEPIAETTATTASTVSTHVSSFGHEIDVSTPQEDIATIHLPAAAHNLPSIALNSPESQAQEGQSSPDVTFARRIQSLLSTLPASCIPSLLPMKAPLSYSDESKILPLVSSASAMQDSLAKGRDSVMAMLDNIRPKYLNKARGEELSIQNHNPEMELESTSIMISSPLQPTSDTEVEIARSDIISIDLAGEETVNRQGEHLFGSSSEERPQPGNGEEESRSRLWPFGWASKEPKVKEYRVWYPSQTKVSLQAFWWGYRIYLPPPVMLALNDKSLEATKRAAMIAAALTWLVSHIPLGMIPPQVRPVVAVAKEIVPLFSYVGAFIAWSWNTVKGFDKGNGVILTATWILPIAIVPGTWFPTESSQSRVDRGTDPSTPSS
ncbi:hypothetical protein M422DRAFT_240201 [Sphaerobolus stellatus SS14]|nr:hypothetical protein M422DRAFT_240201 [Sphaerobolus stellatus SS14]